MNKRKSIGSEKEVLLNRSTPKIQSEKVIKIEFLSGSAKGS